ncbi:hypothetical protein ACSYAD_30560 [Acaryochloris marina NIES-2412]|uniref:hypothetical protein n=1 Tax=Acaryochloris marina TaxID=155978 RepID=UPI0040596A3B
MSYRIRSTYSCNNASRFSQISDIPPVYLIEFSAEKSEGSTVPVKPADLFRYIHTKGQRDTSEVAMHEQLARYLIAYQPDLNKGYLYGRSHIRRGLVDLILREAYKQRVGLSGFSTHSFIRTRSHFLMANVVRSSIIRQNIKIFQAIDFAKLTSE